MHDFSIISKKTQLTLSEKNGAVISLCRDGKELITPASELVTLYFRDENRDLFTVNGSEFLSITWSGGLLTFSGHSRHLSLCVETLIRAEDGFFYFRPSVTGIPEGIILERIDMPQVAGDNSGSVFWPYSEGIEIKNAARFNFQKAAFPDIFHCCGYYPGICQMQFLAYYSTHGGIYFAAHDPGHTTKTVGFGNDGHGNVQLHLETFCGSHDLSEYHSDFDYVISSFAGDWMDAAEIYRDWIQSIDATLKKRAELPEWMSDSPVIVVYPVRGNGTITADPNEYFPYENAMPYIRKFAEKFDSMIMSHLLRWDGHAPWAPPYSWPPMGGIDSLLHYRNMLHSEGHLLGLYCSGTSWTLNSKINDYSTVEQYDAQNLSRFMTRGPKGEIAAVICRSIRSGFGMCVTEKLCRDVLKEQVMAIAGAGVDFVQIMDQNYGGCALLCYSQEHAHPSSPGRWQTEAMRSLLSEMNTEIKRSGSEMIMGAESAAADAYIHYLPFNDLRSIFAYQYGLPVPAHQFIFHQFSNDFMGNQADVTKRIKCRECPHNLLWRIAYSFNAGVMLSVTLRNNGVIDWGAAADWDSPPPDQEHVIILIRNLNRLRKKHPEFLQYGKMLKPLIKLKGKRFTLNFTERDEIIDAFTFSCWESPNGETAQIITNFLPEPQTISAKLKPGYEARYEQSCFKDEFTLELSPLSVLVLNVSKATTAFQSIIHVVT